MSILFLDFFHFWRCNLELNVSDFFNRLDDLLKKNCMTAKELTEKLSLSKTSISEWRKGKTTPSVKALIGISQIFNVSLDWLILGKQNNLSSDEELLLSCYNKLSEIDKGKLIGNLEVITHSDNFLTSAKLFNSPVTQTKNNSIEKIG